MNADFQDKLIVLGYAGLLWIFCIHAFHKMGLEKRWYRALLYVGGPFTLLILTMSGLVSGRMRNFTKSISITVLIKKKLQQFNVKRAEEIANAISFAIALVGVVGMIYFLLPSDGLNVPSRAPEVPLAAGLKIQVQSYPMWLCVLSAPADAPPPWDDPQVWRRQVIDVLQPGQERSEEIKGRQIYIRAAEVERLQLMRGGRQIRLASRGAGHVLVDSSGEQTVMDNAQLIDVPQQCLGGN